MKDIIKFTSILLLCIASWFVADSFEYKRSPDQRDWEYVTVEVVNKWQSDSCSKYGCDEDYYFTILTEDLVYKDIGVTYEFYNTTALFDKVKVEKSVGNSSIGSKNDLLNVFKFFCILGATIVIPLLAYYISEYWALRKRAYYRSK